MTTESESLHSPNGAANMTDLGVDTPVEGDMHRNDERGLDEIKALTHSMREHQEQIARLARRRREVVLRLRGHRVTYRELAEAMGVSEVTVYKVIRGDQ